MLHRTIFILFFALIGPVSPGLAASTNLPSIELTNTLHFLTSAGESVEVPPGSYYVDRADSWLKLFPEGQDRSAVILLDAKSGNHEESLTDASVRVKPNAENSDVFHLALLHVDGSGLEAVGSSSGVFPRDSRFAFLTRPGRLSSTKTAGEQCSPLQVSNMRLTGVRRIIEGENPVGVTFHIIATVRNTNREKLYRAHEDTFFNMFARDNTGQAHGSQAFNLDVHMPPGGTRTFATDRSILLRRPQDRTKPFHAQLEAHLFNRQCQTQSKQYSTSTFVYDLMPVYLDQGEAKRLSARITGGSEAKRPRAGRGAPAPRRR